MHQMPVQQLGAGEGKKEAVGNDCMGAQGPQSTRPICLRFEYIQSIMETLHTATGSPSGERP